MSFRKNKNTHDEWVAFRDEISDLFPLFINGDLELLNEKSFEEYLTEGTNESFHTSITELSNDDFLTLEKIVNEWENFSDHYHFDTFDSERFKRFNRYG